MAKERMTRRTLMGGAGAAVIAGPLAVSQWRNALASPEEVPLVPEALAALWYQKAEGGYATPDGMWIHLRAGTEAEWMVAGWLDFATGDVYWGHDPAVDDPGEQSRIVCTTEGKTDPE